MSGSLASTPESDNGGADGDAEKMNLSPFLFPRRLRVIRGADFGEAVRGGPRTVDQFITVWGRRNGLPHARLGLIVGRKHGGAPQRNRLKRVLREAFRLSQHDLPAGLDLICAPRRGAEITLAGSRKSLMKHARTLERRLAPSTPKTATLNRSAPEMSTPKNTTPDKSTPEKCGEDAPSGDG